VLRQHTGQLASLVIAAHCVTIVRSEADMTSTEHRRLLTSEQQSSRSSRVHTKRLLVSLFLLFSTLALPASARSVAGIEIPEILASADVPLVLNGVGIRTRYFLDVYVGGLYLQQKNTDAAAILDADERMAIKLWVVTGLITNDRMQESIEEGFQRSTRGDTAPIREKIDALIGLFDDEIEDEDTFEFVYVPGNGLDVYKNGVHRAAIDCGLPFKRALFGIWISDRSVQTSLKHSMLGR
jgi:hypothetical protein